MDRLNIIAADLAEKLQRASPTKQRAASLVACQFGMSHTGIDHPLVHQALGKLRSAQVVTVKEKADIDSLVEELDEKYFDLKDAAEEGHGSQEEWMRLFAQARAVAALSFASEEDSLEAAKETIYEAAASTEDEEALLAVIHAVLDE